MLANAKYSKYILKVQVFEYVGIGDPNNFSSVENALGEIAYLVKKRSTATYKNCPATPA